MDLNSPRRHRRVVAIVQARMGSSRLPGKVLMTIGPTTVLGHVLQRAAASLGVDVVCCATTIAKRDDAIETEAMRYGVSVLRGSESDVLGRYVEAAKATDASIVVRITADCPLLDPQVVGDLIELMHTENADYASNDLPASWPKGLDCEAFTNELLVNAAKFASGSYDREHVTPWMRRDGSVRRVSLVGPGGAALNERWTIDYSEDLAFVREVARHLSSRSRFPGWQEIMDVLRQHPEIRSINAMHAVRFR